MLVIKITDRRKICVVWLINHRIHWMCSASHGFAVYGIATALIVLSRQKDRENGKNHNNSKKKHKEKKLKIKQKLQLPICIVTSGLCRVVQDAFRYMDICMICEPIVNYLYVKKIKEKTCTDYTLLYWVLDSFFPHPLSRFFPSIFLSSFLTFIQFNCEFNSTTDRHRRARAQKILWSYSR